MRFSSRCSPDRGGVPSGTRLPLRLGIAGAVALSALLLGGCVQPAPVKTPQAHATVKPLFASDADALAAATKAYAAYLKMSDTITSEGGANPQRINGVAEGDAARDARDGFAAYQSKALHSRGASKFDTVSLQQLESENDGGAVVRSYVCLDVSDVRVLDSAGADVTPLARESRLPLEIVVEFAAGLGTPKLSESTSWSGTNFC
jgi:hypothetical protein